MPNTANAPHTVDSLLRVVEARDAEVTLLKLLVDKLKVQLLRQVRARFGDPLENAKKAVEDFNRAGKVLQENGITFCYHDHGYEFQPYGEGTLMDYIIQNTDPKYVSFEMDVLWTQFGGGDPVKLLNKYPTRWKLMHLKDLKKGVKGDLTGGTPAENDVPLGSGQVAMEEVIRTAKKIGIKHFFIEDESNQELEFVPISIAYLKSLKQ